MLASVRVAIPLARDLPSRARRALGRIVRRRRVPRPEQRRVAYLCDQYPAISHTFILREVRALRALGIDIETISIRRSDPEQLLAERDRDEFSRTFAVLPLHVRVLLTTHARVFAAHPRRYVDALRLAGSLAQPGSRGHLWQLFYLAEAGVVWAHCRRVGVRHIHAQFTSPAADVALLAAHLGGPGCSWSFAAHGTDIFETDRKGLGEKVRRARFVICVSDFGRSQLMALVDERHWPKIHVISCGIDVREFAPQGWKRSPGQHLRVLSVGRLVASKGHAVLLDALAQLLEAGVSASLDVIGDGPRRQALETRARALGVAEHVTFHGRVGQDDIRRHYAAADVFCLPSFAEGVPVVLMEAMAMELPVVASGVMGIPELVEDRRSGLLVPPGRADALVESLAALATSVDLRLELGCGGRARIESAFSLERSALALREVYAGNRIIAETERGQPTSV
jgi:colanic acid/amylovoran biosynthesis glycosyltransferase